MVAEVAMVQGVATFFSDPGQHFIGVPYCGTGAVGAVRELQAQLQDLWGMQSGNEGGTV